jgi:glycosyltransferase involved in cell wall biosynthesis
MRPLRIAYPMRVDALDKPGGDALVIQKYIAGGAGTSPAFSGELIVNLNADLSSFDIIHLTNIDRPAELYHYFRRAREMRKPIILSPIHHSYAEIERFEREARAGTVGLFSGLFSFSALEILRCLVRSAKYPDLLLPLLRLILQGTRKAQNIVLAESDGMLVTTEKEREDIARDIGPADPVKVVCLRNGVDVFRSTPDIGQTAVRDLDVCVVARIEARKNQNAVLRALNNLGRAGVFVGPENPNHESYCAEFKRMIGRSRSEHVGGLSHAETLAIMKRAKVHVSASWFEVSSMVDIDAFNAGCRVVASVCGGTRELLGAGARYIDPGSPAELEAAIAAALEDSDSPAPAGQSDPQPGLEGWESVTAKLAILYQDLLDRP